MKSPNGVLPQLPSDDDEPEKPSSKAVWLSLCVLPGVGQFVQRRWVPALFYALGTLVCTGGLMYAVLWPWWRYIQWAIDVSGGGDGPTPAPLSKARIAVWLVVLIGVYAAGVLDTAIGQRRLLRQWVAARQARRRTGASS